MLTLGVDVGGSKILACLIDEECVIRAQERHVTGRDTTPANVIKRIEELTHRFISQGATPSAIGIGFPGLVDHELGVVRSSIMLDRWREVPLAAEILGATGIPCVIENDVNAAAIYESALRSHDADSMLFVAVGTGIGGALTFEGRLWRGASGVAGEIGNMVIDRDGALCWCGRRGCLNTVASGPSIETAAGIGAGTLAEKWQAEDPSVIRAVDEGARALAIGLGNAANLINPSLIVLGGGVAELGPRWLGTVQKYFHTEAFHEITAICRIDLARAGYQAGAVGAARLANEALRNKAPSP